MPALLADPMTRWMGRPTTVTKVVRLSPGLLKVGFSGDALRGRAWRPGCEIEFRVGERELRHYTPSAFDEHEGWIEVLFQLHGEGPGSLWASRLAVGDDVLVLGPGSRAWLREGSSHLFAGDGTTVGLFDVLIAALGADAEVAGAVEVPERDMDAAGELLPRIEVVRATERPGEALARWMETGMTARPDAAYLAGHAQTIQALRARLCSDAVGMRRRNVVTKPYWATGKRGL
ncbi:siderophore-interacting protein [Streptosporangium sp. NPDC051023]|uniref:siderophore-interacting protein n=1 Tax=Streptosporangium sp. NPDC051023 TaxID=3155410 RepID=UPI00344B1438